MNYVYSWYVFTPLSDLQEHRDWIHSELDERGVVGTVLLAEEGLNCHLVHAQEEVLKQALSLIAKRLNASLITVNRTFSQGDHEVFYRLKVKVQSEIVNFGKSLTPQMQVGDYALTRAWDDLMLDDDVVFVDVRNDYEVAIGSFKDAISVGTKNFREFPERAKQLGLVEMAKPLALYCTGGIRCEKASNWLLEAGAPEVYQLDGGILRYLEESTSEMTNWEGECFVFDQRVSVDRQLNQGTYEQCHACRRPITKEDRESPSYKLSVSCPHCYAQTSAKRKARFAERARQQQLAKSRGVRHVGLHQS